MTDSVRTDIQQDTILVGIGASPGIAIGSSHLVNRARTCVMERSISAEEVEQEIALFRQAIDLSRQQLEEVKANVVNHDLAEHLYIIDTHLLILDDQMLVGQTEAQIRQELINAGGALRRTLSRFRQAFADIEDEYLRERHSDVDSVGERLMRNLLGVVQESLQNVEHRSIVVAHLLSPADTMQMDKSKIVGFVTDLGGRTSHTAILARSLGIPAVVGLETATAMIPEHLPMIVDGIHGTVVLNPSAATFKEYLQKKQSFEYLEKELLALRDVPAETLDGKKVTLCANVEFVEEIDPALRHGAQGIGLFRTEFLFMNRNQPPDEEEQVAAYRNIVERMAPDSVTIRTLDVGGDKFVPEINLEDEANPAMGLRAIRFSLKEVKLFRMQLRAILRASAFGKVRLMFPMISGIRELRDCLAHLAEVKAELKRDGCPFDDELPVGIMVETPAAAMIAELLAREVDFFSIGTNDLIQYCLAVDRGNENVAYLYEPLHPAVLRALKMTCDAARNAGIEVSMCGEMAGDPLYVLVLLGLGFDQLSMNAPAIPRVKQVLRQLHSDEGWMLLKELLTLATAADVTLRIEDEMLRRFPKLFLPTPL